MQNIHETLYETIYGYNVFVVCVWVGMGHDYNIRMAFVL